MFIPEKEFVSRWKQTGFEYQEKIYHLYLDFLNPETLRFDYNLSLFLYSQMSKVPFFEIINVMKKIIEHHYYYYYPKFARPEAVVDECDGWNWWKFMSSTLAVRSLMVVLLK